MKTIEDFTEFEQRTAYFDGDIATATKKGVNPLERGSQVDFMADFQAMLDLPPAPKLDVFGKLDPNKATQAEMRGQEIFFGKATDSRTLSIWLNGYHSGASGKTLIDPNAMGERALIEYCIANSEMSVLNAARNVLGIAGNGR